MSFKVVMSSACYRKLKKMNVSIKKQLVVEAKKLIKSPEKGGRLRGRYKKLRSLHFMIKKTDYRLIYSVNKRKKEVLIVWGGTRENLYKQLDRLKLKV